jgi:predicted ferric reductase
VTAAGRLAGLLGAYLVLVQLLLMARIAWFERAVGFDRLTAWHRGLGTNTVLLLVVHVLLIVDGYSLTDHRGVASTGWRVLSTYPSMLRATAGLLLFGLVAVTSARAARRRLSYEAWYAVHLTAYVAVALAFSHQLAAGQDFVGHPINRALWWGLYIFVAVELVRGRVLLPIRTWFRHRLLVDGGSGIGPIRALAEELVLRGPRHHLDAILVYRAGHVRDLALRAELDHFAQQAGLRVVYLVGHRSELGSDPLSAAELQKLVPDVRSRDVYVCGPAGMTHNVLRAMRELRVPVGQLHSEDFEMA